MLEAEDLRDKKMIERTMKEANALVQREERLWKQERDQRAA